MNTKNKELNIFLVLESGSNNSTEYIYLDSIYKNICNNYPYKYFGLSNWKWIVGINNKKTSNDIFLEFRKKLDLSISENISRKKVTIYVFIDDDCEYSKTINKIELESKIKNLISKDKTKMIWLQPKDSCFEEFIYYHMDNLKNKFINNNACISKINEYFNVDNCKGENVKKIIKRCFKNSEETKKSVNLIKTNLNKFDSVYIKLFNK